MKSGISQARFNYRTTDDAQGKVFLWISGTDSDIVTQALFNKGIKSGTGSKKRFWKADGKAIEKGSSEEGRIILTPEDMTMLKNHGGLDKLFKELIEQHTPKPEVVPPVAMYAQEPKSPFLSSEGAAASAPSVPEFDLSAAHAANEKIVRSTMKLFGDSVEILRSRRLPAEKLSKIAAPIPAGTQDPNLLAIRDVLIAAGHAQNAGHFAEAASPRDPGKSEKYLSLVRSALSEAHTEYPTVSIESVVGAVIYATCMYGNNSQGPIEQIGCFTKVTTSQVCRYLTKGLQQSASVPSLYEMFSRPAFSEEVFVASNPLEGQSAAAAAPEPVTFKLGSLVDIGHLMHAANIVLRGEEGDKTITSQEVLIAKHIFTHFNLQQTALKTSVKDIIEGINEAFTSVSVAAQKPIEDFATLIERVEELQTSLGKFSLKSESSSSFLSPQSSPAAAEAAAMSPQQSKGQHQKP